MGSSFRLPTTLDVDATAALVDGLLHHVATTRGAVVLDCSRLERVDPSAVGVLVTLVRWVKDQGRECQLDLVNELAQQEIAAIGLDEVLGVNHLSWRAATSAQG